MLARMAEIGISMAEIDMGAEMGTSTAPADDAPQNASQREEEDANEIESSSRQPNDIESSSRQPNEIESSSRQPNEIESSSRQPTPRLRLSVTVGLGSASMYTAQMRWKAQARRDEGAGAVSDGGGGGGGGSLHDSFRSSFHSLQASFHSLQASFVDGTRPSSLGKGVDDEDEDEDEDEDAPAAPPASANHDGLLAPLSRLLDLTVHSGRADVHSGYAGLLDEGHLVSFEQLICALTSALWQGVSSLMAIEDLDHTETCDAMWASPEYLTLPGWHASAHHGAHPLPPHRWALPEYHRLVLAVLASYKPYVSADALLEHLTKLYRYLTLEVERLQLRPVSADEVREERRGEHMHASADEVRAARTVRERILYVLLLWLRRHPDDFEASYWAPGTGASASFVVSGASRLRSLSSFVHDALTGLADETRAPTTQIASEISSELTSEIAPEITSEVGRYLTALERLIRSQREPSEIDSEITSELTGRGRLIRSPQKPSSNTKPPPSAQQSARGGLPSSNASGGARTRSFEIARDRTRSLEIPALPIGGARPEHGLNYWERLLNTAPSHVERALVRELAEQLSVLEMALFRTVRPSERPLAVDCL